MANLLENAFRYSPAGSPIGMTLLSDGLCIWDQGPPIPKQEQERIFERGGRGSSRRNRPGTGLGLALARRLAERNGGSLTLWTEPRLIDPSLPERAMPSASPGGLKHSHQKQGEGLGQHQRSAIAVSGMATEAPAQSLRHQDRHRSTGQKR